MKMILKALLVCLFLNSVVYAGSTRDHISRIGILENGSVILYGQDGWGDLTDIPCSSNTTIIGFDATNEKGKAMLSFAMASYMSKRKLFVTTSDERCVPTGSGKVPVVLRIDIVD